MSWVDAMKGPWLCCPYCGKPMEIRSMEREMSGATHTSNTIRMECRPCKVNIFKEWFGADMPVGLNERKPAEIQGEKKPPTIVPGMKLPKYSTMCEPSETYRARSYGYPGKCPICRGDMASMNGEPLRCMSCGHEIQLAVSGGITVEERVVDRVRARAATGLNKYGTTMERTDLTRLDWLQHAQDEALDLAVYLEKLKGMEI